MNPPSHPVPPRAERVRTVIVDDEPVARRGLRLLLEGDAAVELVGEAGDGPEAVDVIRRTRPELVFLDVQMPGADGFDVLRRLAPAFEPVVVFVTAYDQFALRAFDVHAVDYLLKPFDDARFRAALARAKEEARRRRGETVSGRLAELLAYLERGAGAEPLTGTGLPDRILIRSAGEIFFVKTDEIDWVEAEGDYMKFHVAGRTHLMRETMARLEARLDPRRFVRIHRSTIVNVDRLRKLSPTFGGEYAVVLHDGTKLKLSRGYHERIAAVMKQSL